MIKHELADDWRKHVSTGQEHAELIFSHFFDDWIATVLNVDDEFAGLLLSHLDNLLLFLLVTL